MPGHFTFYSNKISESVAYFDETEFKHAIQVLRYSLGAHLSFTNGYGMMYTGRINYIGKKEFTAEILTLIHIDELPSVILGIGILKSTDRMEWATEKCTELGAKEIWFLQSKNSERSHLNLERLNKVALSALKQSHGTYKPLIKHMNLEEALQVGNSNHHKYIAYCDASKAEPMSVCELPSIIFIGPEGDFTPSEIDMAAKQGFRVIGLGNTILRTETAAMAVLSALRLK